MRQPIRLFFLSMAFLGWMLPLTSYAQPSRMLREIGRSLESSAEDLLRTIDRYTNAINRDPDNGIYYHQRANAYFDRGEYRKAILDYSKALNHFTPRQEDRRAHVYLHRGLSRYILAEYRGAVSDLGRAISLKPEEPDAYYFRGKIYHMALNEPGRARTDFEKVMQFASYPSIQSAYTRLFVGKREEADREVRHMMARANSFELSSFGTLHYNVAGLRALEGRKDDAVRHLRTALQSGYEEYNWLVRDINFRSLANYRPFQELLSRYHLTYQREAVSGDPCNCPSDEDWSDDRRDGPSQPARLITSNLRYEDSNGNNRIDAGEQGYLSFTVQNDGRGDARAVVLQVEDEREVSGLQFNASQSIGTLPPGRSKEIRVAVTGAGYLQEGQADFTLRLLERNGFDAVPLHITVQTGAFSPPDLVIADHLFASQEGGRMRKGIPITLKLAVQNRGRGVAQDVQVRMRLPDNVFSAGDQVYNLGQMAPGADAQIDFEFFTNSRFDAQTVPIEVVISEQEGRYSYQETLSIGINEQLEVNDRVIVTPTPTQPQDPDDISLLSDVDRNLPRARRANPNAVAVVIGNRDYENSDVPPVDYALQDAASMRKYLIESFGFDENNILFLSNATQADFNGIFGTKEDHRARLFNLVRANESDVFVFYSGHGAPDLNTEDAYFVPVDCDPSLVRFNGYAMNTLYDNLAKIPYRSLTVVIDACFSGATDRGTLTPQASIVRIRSKGGVLEDPKAMVFTAATGAQIASWYPEQAHGLFTYYFLKGLQGEANTDRNRTLTLAERRAYLEKEVPYMARRMRNRDQNPEVYGEDDRSLLSY